MNERVTKTLSVVLVRRGTSNAVGVAASWVLCFILIVGYLLGPVDSPAIEGFIDSDMSHRGGRTCAMPMLLLRWNPHHVARTDFVLWPS